MGEREDFVYRFAGFTLEPRERRLGGSDRAISLTPKVFDTLVLLVAKAGRVVSKDELMKSLWPRGFVDEATLSNHIWQLRRALGDTSKAHRIIETVPKVGYRFAAPVDVEPAGNTDVRRAALSAARDPALGRPDGRDDRGVGEIEPSPAPQPVLPPVLPPALPPAPPPASSPMQGPVAAPASTEILTPSAAPEARLNVPATHSWSRVHSLGIGIVGLAVAAALVVGIVMSRSKAPAPVAAGARATIQVVALVGFNNLSQNSKDAWLAPALTSMLGTELGAANSISVASDELVREASADLGAPLAGGYGRETLNRLRKRLNADYILSGSYLVATSAADPAVRVDIALQDAHTGVMTVTVSNDVALSTVTTLARRVGGQLRAKLGVPEQSVELLDLVANAEPPTTDVARRIGFAIDAMNRYDAARARDELLEVVAEAPAYAPAYLYLARAWSTLGFQQKALAAAEQAGAHAASLTPEFRLLIDAEAQNERYDRAGSAKSWTALIALKPASMDYRLEAIAADLANNDSGAALSVLADLRRLPLAQGDPRVELAAARIAAKQSDVKSAATFAARAVQESQARDAPGIIADAKLELGIAMTRLGEADQAKVNFRDAIDTYRAIGNPRGEAQARRRLASALEGQAAREEFQRAIALAQGIGEDGVVAGVYRDICELLWTAGDRDGAQVAARRALEISRRTGELDLQAWTLRAVATIAADEAATDEVMRDYREVTALTERSNDRGGHVWSLVTYADTLRMRGELSAAVGVCAQAQAEAASLSDPQFAIYATFTCGLLSMDRGESAIARTAFEATARLSKNHVAPIYEANSEMMLAQLDLEESQSGKVCDRFRNAAEQFKAKDASTGEADADAELAICAARSGNTAERDRALARAKLLRAGITAKQEIYFVDIAVAQLADGPQQRAASISQLREIAADAGRRHWLAWSLEAKLAAWRLARIQGDAALSATLGNDLRNEARAHGFGRIVKLMGENRG
jgi:DNA-binding winged helix-turn-helix (wHTH) protein/tetratricopeptide (TPR) repeat protein